MLTVCCPWSVEHAASPFLEYAASPTRCPCLQVVSAVRRQADVLRDIIGDIAAESSLGSPGSGGKAGGEGGGEGGGGDSAAWSLDSEYDTYFTRRADPKVDQGSQEGRQRREGSSGGLPALYKVKSGILCCSGSLRAAL